MAKNDFQYGGWNSYTLQCGMWLWSRDSEFTKWQHPVMWYVALGWHAIEFAQTSAILEFYIWFRFRPHYRSPTCHSATVSDILSKSDHPRQKKMTSCPFSRWWISAILDFRGPITGSLKSPYTTSYRSLIETIALTCLVFEKITVFCILATDRQTNEQTTDALSRSRCRKRRFNNAHVVTGKAINILLVIVKCW